MIHCNEPEVPVGSFVVGYDFNFNSKIEYHCEAGYILQGKAIHTCTKNGEWSEAVPTCRCEFIYFFM